MCFLSVMFCASCDYLDIVPDEMDKEENAFEDPNAAKRFIFSCYGYLPLENTITDNNFDMVGVDVVTSFTRAQDQFAWGNYSAANPIISQWKILYSGLRQCFIFLNNVNSVPGLSDALKKDYAAQAKFLVGYYYYQCIRAYGPMILVKDVVSINSTVSDYQARSPLDECVDYACQMLDEAAADLPGVRGSVYEYGLATNVAAKAVKAKLLLYAASPLFNGNSEFYSEFKNKDGEALMPLTYDAKKWDKARDALKEAIDLAEANGYSLYQKTDKNVTQNFYPEDPTQHCLRYVFVDYENKETLFADTRQEGVYELQNNCFPQGYHAWNAVSPTWEMLGNFYTKNGLPWDEDPEFMDKSKTEVIVVDEAHKDQAKPGRKTIAFNLDREPRFYAWVAFQNGYYEILSQAEGPWNYSAEDGYESATVDGKVGGRVVCDFVIGGLCSRGNSLDALLSTNYAPTGYLNKKGCDPTTVVGPARSYPNYYPWPIIRLADLYLGYSEACVETNDLESAKEYLNKVRTRAGIPTVEVSWSKVPGVILNQTKLREIVRQERRSEFYFEKQSFWDLRRWKIAENVLGRKVQGMNSVGTTVEDFSHVVTLDFERNFVSPKNYLMPISVSETNKNPKFVNNPGY
jgi:hypothetical protein